MSIESIFPTRFHDRLDADIPPPPEKERELIAFLGRLYERAFHEKQKHTKPWKEVYRYYVGNQWGPLPDWMSDPMENQVFAKVETMVPVLTDHRPRIDYVPNDPDLENYADAMQELHNHEWERDDLDSLVPLVVKNMLMFGKGIFYNYYDPDKGHVVTESVDPQNLFPDPYATSVYDARYLIHVTMMTRDEILAMWPEAEGKIRRGARAVENMTSWKGDSRAEVDSDKSRVLAGYQYAEDVGGAFGPVVPWVKSTLGSTDSDDEMVQVLQFWIRDRAVDESEAIDPTTGAPILDAETGRQLFEQTDRFPGGRLVIVAGDRVLVDGPNPYWHGQFPYVEVNCHGLAGEFWPISAAQNLISLQKVLNKLNQLKLDNARLMGSAQWIVDKSSGIEARKISAEPGLVIKKNTPTSVAERVPGTALPNFITEMTVDVRQAMDSISGIHDVTQGRRPSGVTAGVAIEQLQEAAQTRLRFLTRMIDSAMANLGRQRLALMQQFMEQARMVRIVDDASGQVGYMMLTPEMVRSNWEIRVAAGSMLPYSREFRQRQADKMIELGVFDEAAYMEYSEIPGAKKILQRIMMRRGLQETLAAIMAGSGGGGGALPGPAGQPSSSQSGPPPTLRKPQVAGRGNGRAGVANLDNRR